MTYSRDSMTQEIESSSICRRDFWKWVLTAFAGMSAVMRPTLGGAQKLSSKEMKTILPKGTKPGDLVSRNPKELDTRNLEVTRLEDFGTMGLEDHQVDLESWRLLVEGEVDRPLGLTYSELLSLPSIVRKVLLICPGVFVNHGVWTGVSMKALLDRAKIRRGANFVTFAGPEGNYEKVHRVPLQEALEDKAFLAYQVNGKPLPRKHGFPLRLVAEDYYGYDWVKYVYKVTVARIGG